MSDPITQHNAVTIDRIINAPVATVWAMWTDPEHFKNWYGPTGFTVPVAEIELRVGGKHLFCMKSPDGSMTMWTTGEYLEIVPNKRLVYTDIYSDEHGNALPPPMEGMPATTQVTVVLENLGDSTKMTITHAGVPADADGASAGWSQAFDKMEAHIKNASS